MLSAAPHIRCSVRFFHSFFARCTLRQVQHSLARVILIIAARITIRQLHTRRESEKAARLLRNNSRLNHHAWANKQNGCGVETGWSWIHQPTPSSSMSVSGSERERRSALPALNFRIWVSCMSAVFMPQSR